MSTALPTGRTLRRVAEVVAILAVVVVIGSFARGARLSFIPFGAPTETITWYCAGEAVNARADPYLVEPLRSCEIAHHADRPYPYVEPAPHPGYTLALFALFARLPFEAAQTLLVYLLVASVVLTAVLLARLTRTPPLLALLCLAPLDGYVNLMYREIPPIAVAALTAAAALGSARRYSAAAVCAGLAMIEPHIGLPGCLAMFVWWPNTRRAFVGVAAVLAAASLAAVGVHGNIEYIAQVLPAHAAAEISAADQYSLTRVLHLFGIGDGVALRLGSLSYVAATVVGVGYCRALATAAEAEALVPLFPPAVAMLGGVFVHDIQVAAAIPAAFVIALWARPPLVLRAIALITITFTWQAWYWDRNVRVFPLEVAAVVAAVILLTRAHTAIIQRRSALLGAVLCVTLALGIDRMPVRSLGPPTRIAPFASAASDLASANWAASVTRDTAYSTPHLKDLAEKLPLWLGLGSLTAIGIVYSRRRGRPASAEI